MANLARRQIQAVLSTYLVWWFSWLILALYLLGLTFVITINREPPTSLRTSFTLETGGQTWDRLPADLTKVDHIVFNPNQLAVALQPGSPLRIPGRLPKLERIVVFESVSEHQLIELLEFQRLRTLILIHLQPLTDHGWAALESQPLEGLQIFSMDRQAWVTGRWPKTVQTLLIQDDQQPIHDPKRSHLEPLLSLPRLRTLEVRLLADKDGHLRNADRDALLNMTALKYLYVQAPDSWIPEIQRELPGIVVRPNSYNPQRVSQAIWLSALSYLPLILILQMVSMQFVVPASLLIPDYRRRHWQTTMGLLCCWAFIQASTQYIGGSSLIFAVATSGMLLVPTFAVTIFLERTNRFPGYTHFAFMFAAGPLTLPVLPLTVPVLILMQIFGAESDWMIQGHRPDIAAGLISLTIASGVGLHRFFHRLCRGAMATAQETIPFGIWRRKSFDRCAMEGSSVQNWQNRFWDSGQRRRFMAIRQSRLSARNYQALLWRASQPTTAFEMGWWTAIPIMLAGGLVIAFDSRSSNWSLVWPFGMQVGMYLWMLPVVRLISQRPFLARLYLSSCDRRAWVRMIFRETARDFVPAIVFTLSSIVVYARIDPNSPLLTPLFFASVTGLLLVVYGATLFPMTFSVSTIIAIIGGLLIGSIPVIFCVISLDLWGASDSDLYRFACYVGCPAIFVIAAVIIPTAYRRWLTQELG